jgi:hypothetical protein
MMTMIMMDKDIKEMQARAHEYVKWVFTGYGNNLHFFCLLNYGLWQERND